MIYVLPNYILFHLISTGAYSPYSSLFKLTDFGKICSDTGKDRLHTIVDQVVCRKAANELGKIYGKESSWSNYPKGCCLNNNKVYWNKHVTGQRNGNTKEICLEYG